LDASKGTKQASQPTISGPSFVGATHRDLRDKQEDRSNIVGPDQLSQMMNMMQLMVGPEATGSNGIVDLRVAPVHEEFSQLGLFPRGADVTRCQQKLWDWYQNARSCMMKPLLGVVSKEGFCKFIKLPNMRKRTNGHPDLEQWCLQSPPPAVGSVFVKSDAAPEAIYSPGIHQSFSNAPRESLTYEANAVHVAVGFVDLGELLFSDTLKDTEGVRWVGYELSPFVIAKTEVILNLLRSGVSTEVVLQIWFSSTWTRAALRAFQNAASHIIATSTGRFEPMILRILALWRDAPEVQTV
jgi:hypothetical protein